LAAGIFSGGVFMTQKFQQLDAVILQRATL